MRYAPYPKYKPSGIRWLGDVPEHWEVKRARFVASINPVSKRMRKLDQEEEVSFVPMDAIAEYGGLSLDKTRTISEIGSGYTEFEDGDVIVAKITPCFENGKGALAKGLTNGVAYGTTELHVFRTQSLLDNRFLFYVSMSSPFRKLGEAEMYGAGGQKRVPPEYCRDFPVLLSSGEQRVIADFLDSQTTKIDALVAKRRQLIDKLKEKRTALISRTVTRGLPPDAAKAAELNPHPKLKPSGVEWLGEIPGHWDAGLIKRWYHVHLGKMLDGSKQDGDGLVKPYLRAANIHWNAVLTDDVNEMKFTESERLWYRLRPADLLVTEGGVTVGRSAIWQGELEECYFQNSLNRVRPKSGSNIKLLYYWLYAAKHNGLIDLIAEKSTFGHLTKEKLEAFDTVFISEPEAGKIVAFLDHETAKIDRMVLKVEEAIEKLQEYRTALITAAVTGKIDVRNQA